MSHECHPAWRCRLIPVALLTTGFLLLNAAATPAATPHYVVDAFKPIKARVPKTCERMIMGMSGLCLLASTSPKATNAFLVRSAQSSQASAQPKPAPFNAFLPLTPGQYLVYSASGMDTLHELPVTVFPGVQTVVQTGVVKFNAGAKAHRLQHYQSAGGIDGRGCQAEIVRSGALVVLPSNYQANAVDKAETKSPPPPLCLTTGVTFNVLAGQGVTGSFRSVVNQEPPTSNTYTHPDRKSSLASISNFLGDVSRLAILPRWRTSRGVHNPDAQAHDVLILYSSGTRQFMVPFTWREKKRECGISLAKAGVPAHVLLTDCQFRGRRLTGFRVQPGSYYTVNNRHGKNAIEGNFINIPIVVSGVNFDFRGGH